MVIMGYPWFLYQGREERGIDIDGWLDLVAEEKALRKEVSKIAENYDERLWRERQEESERNEGERRNVERGEIEDGPSENTRGEHRR
ncbi:hypothetical protein POSPLADRAFT_1061614 [Postia placenta MAD-698-R-SB12]|uniref:Uncharacterized protein n=1 Tax=Postia placenta MAD-698-R-SB12 TaxID=670580 RepID=A0A1X6MM43_9APHY|nr:hypothetical protein POSPLADRAFT_1061614 [Postia placenta MAD-698-R-SB12]OSX57408.1 hypothetical protein POSPLADRAFT_1061614 [Postia placenta MAD-698-R-SB12]